MTKKAKYRPKPVVLDVMAYVKASMKPLAAVGSELVKLRIINHDALLALAQGRSTLGDMNKLIEVGNMSEALAHQGFGKDWEPEIRAGQDALLTVARRDKWVCRSEELSAIREMVEVNDAQLDVVTIAQLEKGMAHIREVKRNKRARRIKE